MTDQTLEALAQFSDGLADAVERAAVSTVRVDARHRIAATGVAWTLTA